MEGFEVADHQDDRVNPQKVGDILPERFYVLGFTSILL